jgi:hypothetical protein
MKEDVDVVTLMHHVDQILTYAFVYMLKRMLFSKQDERG